MMQKSNIRSSSMTRTLVVVSFLLALEIILTRFFSITLPITRIGFGFLPIAVCAILYGPLWAGASYAVGDVIGGILWPSGPFFPGFTLTAFLTGVTYGLILHKKELTWPRLVVAVVVVLLLYTVLLNTLWLKVMYGKAFLALLPTRLIQAGVMLPVQVATIRVINDKVVKRIPTL